LVRSCFSNFLWNINYFLPKGVKIIILKIKNKRPMNAGKEQDQSTMIVMDWMSHEHEKVVVMTPVVEVEKVKNYPFVMDGYGTHMN
jgi:hypothetical protein